MDDLKKGFNSFGSCLKLTITMMMMMMMIILLLAISFAQVSFNRSRGFTTIYKGGIHKSYIMSFST